jgi:hypothetical protein
MPRYTGLDARWEGFRRWLILRLTRLRGDAFLIVTAPGVGFVQFINEGGDLLGECSDPAAVSGESPSPDAVERILGAGWGAQDVGISPNFRVLWFPTCVPTPDGPPWTPPLDDAIDAADLACRTLRDVFGVEDPRQLDVDGGQSMTVTALDAELGSLFPGDD